MSTPDPNILLDLHLDTLADGQVHDASPNQRHATARGNLAPVYAAEVGRCLAFDGAGSYLELPALDDTIGYAAGFTVEALVWFYSFPSWARIVDFGAGPGDRNIILATDDLNQGNLVLQIWADAVRENAKTLTAAGALAAQQWLHLAATIDPLGRFQLYRNGLALFDAPQDGVLPPDANRGACYIGHSSSGTDGDFKGRMAFVRVYNRPLSESELWSSYAASLVAPTHITHPLGYELYDDNQEPVLYIEDNPVGPGQRLHLDITNTAGLPLYFKPDSDYHFEMRFARGVLAAAPTLDASANGNQGWTLDTIANQSAQSRYDAYTLRRAADSSAFAPSETIRLTLTNLKAGAQGGSRGTRIELLDQGLFSTPTYEEGTELDDIQLRHLNIVNHRGVKQIPLHVGIVGAGIVLNDGAADTSRKLTLRITNTSPDHAISLRPPPSDPSTQPQFILSVDASDNLADEWALASIDQANHIHVRTAKGELTDPSGGQSATPEWAIDQEHMPVDSLGPRKHFDITLSNIATKHPSGATNLYMRYVNIPGYWDGQFVCQISKAPLLFHGQQVGIGTAAPRATLEVSGGAIMPAAGNGEAAGILFSKDPGGGSGDAAWLRYYARQGEATTLEIGVSNDGEDHIALMPSGNVGIGTVAPQSILHISSGGGNTLPKVTNTGSGAAGWELLAGGEQNSWIVHATGKDNFQGPGKLVFRCDTVSDLLTLDKSGNVGIGTTAPASKLAVAGGMTVGADYAGTAAPANGLIVQGNVGIGTNAPQSILHVSSPDGNTLPKVTNTGNGAAGWELLAGSEQNAWIIHATGKGNFQGAGKLIFRYGAVRDSLTLDASGNIGIVGRLLVNGATPIVVLRYVLNQGANQDTGYSVDDYSAAIVGFRVDGDIEEKNYNRPLLQATMEQVNGKWIIVFGMTHDRADLPVWTIDVMFMRKELVQDNRPAAGQLNIIH